MNRDQDMASRARHGRKRTNVNWYLTASADDPVLVAKLESALGSLRRWDREVFLASRVDQLTYAEIAERYGNLTDFELWSAAEDRLLRDYTVSETITAPVSFIVHSLTDVNNQLERGRPFFIDIIEQGIALYEAEGTPFAQPRLLPPDEARAEAQKHFDEWFATAEEFLAGAEFHRERQGSKVAAFNYHQAAERFYHCALLVLTLYSPKSHRLNFLRSQAELAAPELIEAWPRGDRFARRCFELLLQAYVNARYSPHYVITDEELRWLGKRVAILRDMVRAVCEKRLATVG